MKKLLCALIVLSMLTGLCACTQTAEPAPPPEIAAEDLYAVEIEEKEWPIIDGSAAFLPYYTAAASRLLGVSEEEASRYVLCSSDEFAYPDLISGKADVIFCPLPNAEQVRLADHAGVTLACYPVLNEALVFFVNPDNPVDSLTRQQLHDIYAGILTNWSEVGGKDEPILAFQHEEGFPGQRGLCSLVIGPQELMDPPTVLREGTMGDVAELPAGYDGSEGAIGFSYLYHLQHQSSLKDVKLISVDGIAPTEEHIAEGSYPLITQACAVIRGGEELSSGEFAQWCAWPIGQALAQEKGYVPNQLQSGIEVPQERESAEEPSSTDWAEGKAASQGSTEMRRNGLRTEMVICREELQLSASTLSLSGLKDKEIQRKIEERILQEVEYFCDPSYVPDVQGIRAYEARGLKPENCSYKSVYAGAEANSGNVLSVLITCDAYYDIPLPDGSSESRYFNTCSTLNIDLNTGKDVPLSAWIRDGADALSLLGEKAGRFLSDNEDSVYSDDTAPAAYGDAAVRAASSPVILPGQKYYLDDQEKTLHLVLDAETPWCISGGIYQTLPVKWDEDFVMDRYALRGDSLFE